MLCVSVAVARANDAAAVCTRAHGAPAAIGTVVDGRAALGMNRADLTAGSEARFIPALGGDTCCFARAVESFCASVLSGDGLAGACVLSAPCCVSLSACGIGLGTACSVCLGAASRG